MNESSDIQRIQGYTSGERCKLVMKSGMDDNLNMKVLNENNNTQSPGIQVHSSSHTKNFNINKVYNNNSDTSIDSDTNLIKNMPKMKEEKIIKEGMIVVKTNDEALVAYSEDPIEVSENVTPKELLNKLQGDNKCEAIYINMKQLEDKCLKDGLIEESGEIKNDDNLFMNRLKRDVDKRHPRNMVNGKLEKIPCCKSSIGFLCCCGKIQSSDFDNLGIGIVMYFRFIKTLLISFFLISLLSSIVIYIYASNNTTKKAMNYLETLFKTTLGNVPNSVFNCKNMNKAIIANNNLMNDNFKLKLNCSEKVINSLTSFGVSQTEKIEQENLANCYEFMTSEDLELAKCSSFNKIMKDVDSKCRGKSECIVPLNISQYGVNDCGFDNNKISYVFFSYSCYEDNIELGVKNLSFTRRNFGFFVVIIDAVCSIMLFATLKIVSNYKEKSNNRYLNERTFIRDFTLQMKNLKIPKNKIQEEFNNLIIHFQNVAKIEGVEEQLFNFEKVGVSKQKNFKDYREFPQIDQFNPQDYYIYDIVYPVLTAGKMSQIKAFNNLKDKVKRLDNSDPNHELQVSVSDAIDEINASKENEGIGNSVNINIPNNNNNSNNLNIPNNNSNSNNIMNNINGLSNTNHINKKPTKKIANDPNLNPVNNENIEENKDKENYSKELKTQLKSKLIQKMDKIRNQIHEDTSTEEIDEIYIIFRNYKIAKFYNDLYKLNRCSRCMKGAKINHLYYKGTEWLDIGFAHDEPTDIKWENRNVSDCSKCCRSFISILLTVLLLGLTIVAMVYVKLYQRKAEDEYNSNVDCEYITGWDDDALVYADYVRNVTSKQKSISYCYCYSQFNAGNVLTGTIEELEVCASPTECAKPCKKFVDNYAMSTAISIALIIAIPVVNSLMTLLMKFLTACQKNRTLSIDLTNNLWKMFIIQFINTGILLLIVNAKIDKINEKFDDNFPLFAGEFKDIDPKWYSNVGATIMFSMLLGIITPHISNIIFSTLTYIRRCNDSGCDCEGYSTKLHVKKDYFDLYTGPSFELDTRYATILTNLSVTLLFSSGIPFLNIVFFLFLFFVYYFDKFLIVSYYRNPPKYDLKILEMFIQIAIVMIIIHFIFAIWIYGNPQILYSLNVDQRVNFNTDKISNILGNNLNPGDNVYERLKMKHNLIICILLLVYFFVLLIKFVIVYCLGCILNILCCCFCCCKKTKKANKIVDNLTCNIEIGLALPLPALYKYYQIKKIEYFNNLKFSDSLPDLLFNERCCIHYIRAFMMYKIFKSYDGNDKLNLVDEFDKMLEKKPEILEKEKNYAIGGDVSYNLCFVPEYESAAYYEYIKNM